MRIMQSSLWRQHVDSSWPCLVTWQRHEPRWQDAAPLPELDLATATGTRDFLAHISPYDAAEALCHLARLVFLAPKVFKHFRLQLRGENVHLYFTRLPETVAPANGL